MGQLSTEIVARGLAQPGSFMFKVSQAATYPLPELRSLVREAEAELSGAKALSDDIEIAWWTDWLKVLRAGVELRLRQTGSKPLSNSSGIAYPNIDFVKERSDIVALASQHTTLKPMGKALKGLCPFHNEHTPSFHVWPAENRFHCFGCNASGSVLDFVIRTQNLNLTEALHFLCDRAGIKWPEAPKKQARPVVAL